MNPWILNSMQMIVKFDRKVEDDHYISPGGYHLHDKNGNTLSIDFNTTQWSRHGTIIEAEVEDLDEEYSRINNNNIDLLSPDNINTYQFNEFFIFTGEYDDPEINPVEVLNLSFEFENKKTDEMKTVVADKNLLKSATKALVNY
jgi:hypothetical protein